MRFSKQLPIFGLFLSLAYVTPATNAYLYAMGTSYDMNMGMHCDGKYHMGDHNCASSNSTPIANAQSVTTDEDVNVAITLSGTDADGDSLSYTIITQPVNGILSGTAPDLTYTPNANFNGGDSFTFVVNDGTADSVEATVTITVNPVNDVPAANAQTVKIQLFL